jgi:hypothetical protein
MPTMSNIAEGFKRVNRQEKLHFYNIARGSSGEVRSLTYVLEDIDLAPDDVITDLREQCVKTGRLISGLMRSFQNDLPSPISQKMSDEVAIRVGHLSKRHIIRRLPLLDFRILKPILS